MENTPKQTQKNNLGGIVILILVLVCAALILADLWNNILGVLG